jgi:hypothetical protein
MGFSRRSKSRLAAVCVVVVVAVAGCRFIDPSAETDKPLAIQRFIAVPAEVEPGTPTTLSWAVEGAESVELDNGIGLVPASGSRTVKPNASTTYLLVAVAGTSLATASIRVEVGTSSPTPSPGPSPSPG